jgi:ribosomal protein S18 acetylase RimI-like enzyme
MAVRIRELRANDTPALSSLLRRVEVFEPHEIVVAEELIEAALGGSPDYRIYVAETNSCAAASGVGTVVGYVCHGHNPVTDSVHDLYWIAVDPATQGRGVARELLTHTEDRVRGLGGRGIVIETSSRREYEPARKLYERCGYRKAADIPDFYKPGDHMLMYLKFFDPRFA